MNGWIGALIAVAAGFAIGSIAGRIVRGVLLRERQPEAIREVAPSIGGFVFALCLATGLITAVGIVSPEQLDTMPRQLIEYLPKVIAAGILLLLGNVASSVVGMVLGRSLQKASGEPKPAIVRGAKATVVAATAILAVSQLGIDTTIVNLAVAALLFSIGATFTLVTALGSRDVAAQLAAGRYVRRYLPVGAELDGQVTGTVVKVHPATVEVRQADGCVVHIPNSELLAGPVKFRKPD